MSAKRAAEGGAGEAGAAAARKKGKKSGGGHALTASDLVKLNALMAETERLSEVAEPSVSELGLEHDVIQVEEMEDEDVKTSIEDVMLEIAGSILAGRGLGFQIPSRTSTSQLYVPEIDRMVLKKVLKERVFANTGQVRKTTITTRVLELIHQVVSKKIHITKRDLFYTDVKLFSKQEESDAVLDDIACMVGCTRTSLNVVASDKGVVVGRVTFLEDGDHIDCTKMGVGGKAIPALVHKITDMKSDAKFILLVEKDAAFMRLAEDRFYNRFPCIIVTGKGQPDVASRLFLKMLKQKLKLPILALMDSDPHGVRIMCTYMKSSKAMSYDSDSLATGDIKWLGVRPTDLNKYKIPEQCRLDMDEKDVREAKALLASDFIIKNQDWVKEIETMLKMKKKAEIQALSSFGFQYLTEEYLPAKIKAGDWI